MDDFLNFVVERHRIWAQRQAGAPQPWTDDPILASKKFTNVFRVLDPGTQFLLTDVFDPELSPRENLMRAFLYRHTGRVETWEALDLVGLGYPTLLTLEKTRKFWKGYRDAGGKFFTNAYLVYPQSSTPGTDKIDSIIDLTARLFTPGSPDDIIPEWEKAETQKKRFQLLNRNKGVGDFMSMQVLTDWGYQCGEDHENEFLIPGPGSIKGAKAIDPNAKTMDVVKQVVEAVRGLPHCPQVGYRRPSLMDIGSNLLCEWSKYVRYKGQAVPTTTYKPAHPGPQPEPVLPSYYNEDIL